jgi:HEAT repeat protein
MNRFACAALSLVLSVPVFAQGNPPPPEPLRPEPAEPTEPADPELQKKIDGLVEKLGSDDWDVRSAAENELSEIGKAATAALKKAAEGSENPEVKLRAKRLLQKLGVGDEPAELDDTQFGELLDLLKAEDGVHWYSGVKPSFYMYQIYQRKEFSDAVKDPKTAPRLAKALEDESGALRRNACYLLADMGNPEVAPQVAKLLGDEDWQTRAIAVHTLGRLGDVKTAGEVLKALSDNEKTVKLIAAAALERLPSGESIEPLMALLKDESADLRFHAYASLRSLTGATVRFNAWFPEEARAKAIKDFEAWWGANKKDFKPRPPRVPEQEGEVERSVRPGAIRK